MTLRTDYEMDYVREHDDDDADLATVRVEVSLDGLAAKVTVEADGPGVAERGFKDVRVFEGRFSVSDALRRAVIAHGDMIDDGFVVDEEYREALEDEDEDDLDDLFLDAESQGADLTARVLEKDDPERAAFLAAWADENDDEDEDPCLSCDVADCDGRTAPYRGAK